jgi:hypothetical protein
MKNIFSKLSTTLAPMAVMLMTTTSAHAAAAATNKVFMSNTLIFLFLGFCALVVTIQLIPAIITLHAMIKGALSNKETKTASVKYN